MASHGRSSTAISQTHGVARHLYEFTDWARRLLPAVALTLGMVQTAEPLFCQTQPSSPSPTYVVHIPALRVAAMSPDEKYVAAIVVHRPKDAPPTAELQVWDFRGGALIRTCSLPAPEPRPGRPHGTAYIRYTSDAQLLAVYTGGDLLHVLRASDLKELRTVQIQPPANVNAFEVSPTAHHVAMRTTGDVLVYNLDSGEEVRAWKISQDSRSKTVQLLRVHPQLDGSGLAWRGDGGALAVSVADNSPCLRGGGTIYIFSVTSKDDPKTFRVSLLPASVAFAVGNKLYVASNTCGGYFAHWALDLPVFDSVSGQEISKISAGKVGFRGFIAISANRRILLAHADREKTTFAGFEDSLSVADEQWQAWDLSTEKLVLALPAKAHPFMENYPSVSDAGHFVYANRDQDLEIFPVSIAEK